MSEFRCELHQADSILTLDSSPPAVLSAKPSGNPSRLAALYISSPESECRYSCRLIKTPDRISERPPRVFLFAGFARCKLCELFLLNAAEIVDQIENTGSYVCFQIWRNTNIRNPHKCSAALTAYRVPQIGMSREP